MYFTLIVSLAATSSDNTQDPHDRQLGPAEKKAKKWRQ
jgi:hypothetical protein